MQLVKNLTHNLLFLLINATSTPTAKKMAYGSPPMKRLIGQEAVDPLTKEEKHAILILTFNYHLYLSGFRQPNILI